MISKLNKKVPKKRASVEFNGMELVDALTLVCPFINNYDDLLSKIAEMKKEPEKKIKFNNTTKLYESDKPDESDQSDQSVKFNKLDDLSNYEFDICKKKKFINNRILNLKQNIKDKEEFQADNINCIFISGKKNNHDEIKILNEGVDKLQAKADIYAKLNNDKKIGISVKQDPAATKSNYSVHVMLGTDDDNTLNIIKNKYLNDNGTTGIIDKNLSQTEKKKYRDFVNSLFYVSNPYFIKLRELIFNKKIELSKKLVEALYCSDVEYDVYEYDGFNFIKLNKVFHQSDITFEEHLPYYFNKAGKERKAAKLFYRLVVKEKVYRVEIRWKGGKKGVTGSPQFLIHNDLDVDDNKVKVVKEKIVKVVKEKKKFNLIIEDDEEEVKNEIINEINELNEINETFINSS